MSTNSGISTSVSTGTDFKSSEGLRTLLLELRLAGPEAWRQDDDTFALMAYINDKYAALAIKHQLRPEDAAYAAFEALRSDAVLTADDPWAVVTQAVRISLIAEERADGLLCSNHQARRTEVMVHHDAERFSDRDNPLTDYHPAFSISAEADNDEAPPGKATQAFREVARLFASLGWPRATIDHALTYVEARLMASGNRVRAHEGLRRDALALKVLDLPLSTWSTLLTVVLGNPHPDYEHTKTGHGLLYRFGTNEGPRDVLVSGDDLDGDLVALIAGCAPRLTPENRLRKALAHAS